MLTPSQPVRLTQGELQEDCLLSGSWRTLTICQTVEDLLPSVSSWRSLTICLTFEDLWPSVRQLKISDHLSGSWRSLTICLTVEDLWPSVRQLKISDHLSDSWRSLTTTCQAVEDLWPQSLWQLKISGHLSDSWRFLTICQTVEYLWPSLRQLKISDHDLSVAWCLWWIPRCPTWPAPDHGTTVSGAVSSWLRSCYIIVRRRDGQRLGTPWDPRCQDGVRPGACVALHNSR